MDSKRANQKIKTMKKERLMAAWHFINNFEGELVIKKNKVYHNNILVYTF